MKILSVTQWFQSESELLHIFTILVSRRS